MKGKLGNYIATAFFINVFAIMSVGGVCILMVKDMVQNISHLEEESGIVSKVYRMNDSIQQSVFMVHNSIINFDNTQKVEVFKILDSTEEELQEYKTSVLKTLKTHANEEILLLEKVQDNINGIRKILATIYGDLAIANLADDSDFKKIESYGFNIHKLTQAINDVHFKTVSVLVNESYNKMYFILLLYLASSLVGILASCVGYVVLTRHTIRPIINLATATKKISTGDLGIRVETASETEIGSLYSSFNAMTEKLQEHEKKREDFNRTLERLVKERTKELRESERSLRLTQSELVRMEKIATLGQIATTVNHEIKTPLNVLYMNLQLLTRKINKCDLPEKEVKEGMLGLTHIIDNEVTRISEIIEEFVKYARFPPPNIKENQINKTLSHLAEMIKQNAHESDIDLHVDLDEKVTSFPFDEKKMIQALLNLCMNAIQAMPYGGSLRIESKKEEHCAKIFIIDTGQGIPENDIEHIFDPFFTKKDGGLGFGLAIVQRIIEDHKGTISCTSEVDKGTTFVITMPLHPAII
ncbi:MAG: HAMP domain-containing protein [Desulfobulbaceae bacterium]|nr:HAMP domain-containing protein [Desulfobulbaceae bacterium]